MEYYTYFLLSLCSTILWNIWNLYSFGSDGGRFFSCLRDVLQQRKLYLHQLFSVCWVVNVICLLPLKLVNFISKL